MRNLKELNAILTAIHLLNYIDENRNTDIMLLTDYAFRRMLDCNSNMKTAICLGNSKENVRAAVMQLLEEDTNYMQYLKEYGYEKKD